MKTCSTHFRIASLIRRKQSALYLSLIGLTVGLSQNVQATLIAEETFEPASVGAFSGANQGNLSWDIYNGDIISTKNLDYNAGLVLEDSGNNVLQVSDAASESNWARFSFAQQSGDIYVSFLASINSGATIFFQPYLDNDAIDTTQNASVVLDSRSTDYVTTRFADGGADAANAINQTLFTVFKLSKNGSSNYNRLQVAFNPTSTTPTWNVDTPYVVGGVAGDSPASTIDQFALRLVSAQATEYAYIDNIRISTSLNNAFAVPEPSSIALILSGAALLRFSRKRQLL